jgi:predicted PurR-regulated permease PerM
MNNSGTNAQQKNLRRIVYLATALIAAAAGIYIFWALRGLIFPIIIGAIAAYICVPALNFAKRRGIPRGLGIFILFGIFFFAITLIVTQLNNILPDEREQLILKTRFYYKIHEKYRNMMGLDAPDAKGNIIYSVVGKDLKKAIKVIDKFVMLDNDEQALFLKYSRGYKDKPLVPDKYYQYFQENLKERNKKLEDIVLREDQDKPIKGEEPQKDSMLSSILEVIYLWIVMPFVFLFLLIDDGEIKKYFVGMIPNKYFEVSLTVMDRVNNAIGNYMRGTLIACALVGLAFFIGFYLIGFEIRLALTIGLIGGITKAIPLYGPVFPLGIGLIYSLIAEEVNSVLPFMNSGNLIIGVIVCVVIIRILDEAIFQPFVVGSAVSLHPLVVNIGLIGGSILFGFAGLLLTIPLIVVVKEFTATLFSQLKEYNII